MAASLPFALAQAFGMVFRGRDHMGLDAWVSVVNKSVALGLAVPALVLGTGLSGVFLSQGLAGMAAFAVAARLYRRVATGPVRWSGPTAREVLAEAPDAVLLATGSELLPAAAPPGPVPARTYGSW